MQRSLDALAVPVSVFDVTVRDAARPDGGTAPARDVASAAAAVLRLAMGRGADGPSATRGDWSLVLEVALRERCSSLAWLRGGEIVRRQAPAHIVARWRTHVLRDHDYRERQLVALDESLRVLRMAGIEPVVLKGAPLADRLYGDPFARPAGDIDLLVTPGDRARARTALESVGWSHAGGAAPWEEIFTRGTGENLVHLELHESLVDNELAHLPWPHPQTAVVSLAGVTMRVAAGPSLAPYLAAHLARHQLPPLLWMIDFATLWNGFSKRERTDATSLARRIRAGRYLTWAVSLIENLDPAADGDRDALARLGFTARGRRDTHAMLRVLRGAETVHDAVRILGAWIRPPALGGAPGAFAARTVERARKRIGRILSREERYLGVTERVPAAAELPRALELEPAELVALVGDVVGRGGAMWIRARGRSMLPAIPSGAPVRVAPLERDLPRSGEVVLGVLPTGLPALHRVRELVPTGVRLRGDNTLADDPVVPLDRILARVDLVCVDGEVVPIEDRPRRSVRLGLARLATLVRLGIARRTHGSAATP